MFELLLIDIFNYFYFDKKANYHPILYVHLKNLKSLFNLLMNSQSFQDQLLYQHTHL
jgi:hypothetical protein